MRGLVFALLALASAPAEALPERPPEPEPEPDPDERERLERRRSDAADFQARERIRKAEAKRARKAALLRAQLGGQP